MQTNRQKTMLQFLIIMGIVVFVVGFTKGGSIQKLGLIEGIISKNSDYTNILSNLKWAALFTTLYGLFAAGYYTEIGNNREGEEHGTAEWIEATRLNKKYRNFKDPQYNKLFTKGFALSYDNKASERNTNTIVIGGSGAGKTFRFAIPNLLNCGCSYVDVDPKGEHLEKAGNRMKQMGYEVSVLNLVDFDNSDCYNPFKYIRKENYQQDIENLVDIVFTSADSQSRDGKKGGGESPFWDNSAKTLLLAIMYFVYFEYPENKRHFGSVMEIKRLATQISGGPQSASAPTAADPLFDSLERKSPEHIALRYWKEYVNCQANVKKDIASTLNSKLSKFNNDKLIDLTRFDDMNITTIGEKPKIIFLVVSDTDTSLNFIVSIFYSQLFEQMFKTADEKYGSKGYPYHVELIMDEFANIKLPNSFEQKLATMRSRNISASIVLQNLAQIKGLFEKNWESIVGNCDEFLYLGGNEQGTAEYVSKLLGKYTLDTTNHSRNLGRNGSDSKSWQRIARDLMTPDELRRLDNDKSILLVRGEQPMKDDKINIFDLPIIEYSAYDSKNGKEYESDRKPMFEDYDTTMAVNFDVSDDLSDSPCYFFVSGANLSMDLIKIKTQREEYERLALQAAARERLEEAVGSRRNTRRRRGPVAS